VLVTPNMRGTEIYPVTMVPCGDDRKVKPFHILHCLGQGCKDRLFLSPGRGRLHADGIVKFAKQKGWLADKRGYVLCPEHKPGAKKPAGKTALKPAQKRAAFLKIRDKDIARAATKHREKPTVPPAATVSEPPLPPPVATIAQKRVIRDFLDTKYDDDNGRWTNDWSDEKAAKQLNMPRAWVTRIREDLYGPDISEASAAVNEEVRALLREAEGLKNLGLSLATKAEQLETRARKYLGLP
jgi:hypothetical protein